MKLLLTQKNDIFDIILEEGLNPHEFNFSEELVQKDEVVTYLRYLNTKYYFMFRSGDISGFVAEYSPAEKSLECIDRTRGGWKQFISRIRKWLRNLIRETNTTDKWVSFKSSLQLIPFAFDIDNKDEKFSSDELKLIEIKIATIKERIKKIDLPSEAINQLNSKLDSLNDKADKLSKTDWKELFIGAIIGTIFNLAISTESSTVIWEIIRQTFKQFILP